MGRIILLLLIAIVIVEGQWLSRNKGKGKKKKLCQYAYDEYSPYYWPGEEHICTKELCDTHPDLGCNLSPEFIHDQVLAHWQENITQEIMYLQRYFDTLIPEPVYSGKYKCEGVCDRGPELVERVFTDIDIDDGYGTVKKRWMCHVIGPKIYRRRCEIGKAGKCNLMIGTRDHYCVPDVTVTMDVWVYCDNVDPGCRKIKIEVPLSCSCKEIKCLPKVKKPPVIPRIPRLPEWAFGPNMEVGPGGGLHPSIGGPIIEGPHGPIDIGLGGGPIHGPLPKGKPPKVKGPHVDIHIPNTVHGPTGSGPVHVGPNWPQGPGPQGKGTPIDINIPGGPFVPTGSGPVHVDPGWHPQEPHNLGPSPKGPKGKRPKGKKRKGKKGKGPQIHDPLGPQGIGPIAVGPAGGSSLLGPALQAALQDPQFGPLAVH